MKNEQVSRTAQMTAFSRGYHYEHDTPKIFEDPLAYCLLTNEERASIEAQIMAAMRTINPVGFSAFPDQAAALRWMMHASAAAPILLARARYAEECLEKALSEGVGQYVMLGAGLDTFAFRRPELCKRIRVLEVDHPATQDYKRKRLAELGWELPSDLIFVPVDFSRESLAYALRESGFNSRMPTFFSWLGVTYYLSRKVVFDTLSQAAEIAPSGSRLVFDYLDNDAYVAQKASPRVLRMLSSVQELGEPMQFGFEPSTLADELAVTGYDLIEDLSPWDIHVRYFMGRTDHYRACEHAHFAQARIK